MKENKPKNVGNPTNSIGYSNVCNFHDNDVVGRMGMNKVWLIVCSFQQQMISIWRNLCIFQSNYIKWKEVFYRKQRNDWAVENLWGQLLLPCRVETDLVHPFWKCCASFEELTFYIYVEEKTAPSDLLWIRPCSWELFDIMQHTCQIYQKMLQVVYQIVKSKNSLSLSGNNFTYFKHKILTHIAFDASWCRLSIFRLFKGIPML